MPSEVTKRGNICIFYIPKLNIKISPFGQPELNKPLKKAKKKQRYQSFLCDTSSLIASGLKISPFFSLFSIKYRLLYSVALCSLCSKLIALLASSSEP